MLCNILAPNGISLLFCLSLIRLVEVFRRVTLLGSLSEAGFLLWSMIAGAAPVGRRG